MRVRYQLDDLSFEAADVAGLESAVRTFLSDLKIDVPVVREDDGVSVDYPDVIGIDAKEDEQIVINFCKNGRFGKAKKVAKELIEKAPWKSDSHRLLAQAYMEEREIDAAVEEAELAVKLDPRNLYALILLANLKARDQHKDTEGMSYYRRAYELYPEEQLAINNYAGMLMKLDQDSALQEKLFRKAVGLSPDYINAYYGLASVLQKLGKVQDAFVAAQTGLKAGKDRPENTAPIRQALMSLMVALAQEAAKLPLDELIEQERAEVEKECGLKIVVEQDGSEGRLARMEMDEKYHRGYHRLVCGADADKPGAKYCVLHELEKLLMRTQTHKAVGEVNLAALPASRSIFKEKTLPYVTQKLRSLLQSEDLDGFIDQLMNGLNGQLMNCPLDFFVFRRLYDKFPTARAHQLAAAYVMASEAIRGAQDGKAMGLPKNVVRANRTLSAVTFLQYRDLMGLDLLAALAPEPEEMNLAQTLYSSCQTFDACFKPGDEWIVVSRFIRDLGCSAYCSVVGLKNDPVSDGQATSTRTFQDRFSSGRDPALNAVITMYMASAIKRFRKMTSEQVRAVAFEIAMLGRSGISLDKKSGYSVPSLGSEDMSGPQMLAHYYVSWATAFPDKVSDLGLPFADEYADAMRIADKEQ